MMKRSVVSIAYDGSSAKGKDRIRRGCGLNEDEMLLSMDLHLVDSFEPLLGDQNPLVSHFRAHIYFQVKIKKRKARAFRGGGGAP